MKRFFLSLSIAIFLSLFVVYRSDGFSLSKIQGKLVSGQANIPDQEILQSLDQPYTYLGKGRQCFVFISEDGKHVIKFINYRRFSLPSWLFAVPLTHDLQLWLAAIEDRRRLRFDETINSFHLAIDQLREETGLEYIHFQQGDGLSFLSLTDRAHRTFQIDLNNIAFVLQKQATPIFDEFETRWHLQGTKGLEEGIAQFCSFVQKRCALQIADDDRDVGINFGFIQGQPILIDPGRIYVDPSLQSKTRIDQETRIATKRLRKWLKIKHPETVAYLDQIVNQ